MVSFDRKKIILFLTLIFGLLLILGVGAYFVFRKTPRCVTGFLDRGKVVECGLVRQVNNKIVIVGKINKLIKIAIRKFLQKWK